MAILIFSGYNRLPTRRLYWPGDYDVQNQSIINAMRRDTFDQIMRCIHFNENMALTEDRFYKVRPIIDHLNKTIKIANSTEFTSIDEIMIPYYGRHCDKQYMRGKPDLATSYGVLVHPMDLFFTWSHTVDPIQKLQIMD